MSILFKVQNEKTQDDLSHLEQSILSLRNRDSEVKIRKRSYPSYHVDCDVIFSGVDATQNYDIAMSDSLDVIARFSLRVNEAEKKSEELEKTNIELGKKIDFLNQKRKAWKKTKKGLLESRRFLADDMTELRDDLANSILREENKAGEIAKLKEQISSLKKTIIPEQNLTMQRFDYNQQEYDNLKKCVSNIISKPISNFPGACLHLIQVNFGYSLGEDSYIEGFLNGSFKTTIIFKDFKSEGVAQSKKESRKEAFRHLLPLLLSSPLLKKKEIPANY